MIYLFIIIIIIFFFLKKAIRGVKEELGLDISHWDHIRLTDAPYLQVYSNEEKGIIDREWSELYLFTVPDHQQLDIVLQESEVAAIQWVPLATLITELENDHTFQRYTHWFQKTLSFLKKL